MKSDMDNCDLYSSMIRLHLVHHAEHEAIFGTGMA
jgi:PadR family transcriptional regulator PadR